MGDSSRRLRLYAGVSLSALVLVLSVDGSARAESNDQEVKALKAQVEQLTRTVNKLLDAQAQNAADAKAAKKQASQAEAQAQAAQAKATAADASAKSGQVPVKAGVWDVDTCSGHRFLEHKIGKDLTFYTHCGEITLYGQLDVSFDGATKNAKSGPFLPDGTGPVGNFGWMPDISTNISYLGARGFQRLPLYNFNFVYQFEAGIDISVTPGIRQSNSNLSNSVNGALFSRNSYIGLASSDWGAIKIGKTDAPYKNSTAAFNPFVGTWGDYAVVMGNTGGDNRVEFGTRLSHSIWYESPKIYGFQFNALYSPGQNRDNSTTNLPSGESDCAGGNDPTSGANPLISCSDGAWNNVVSANLSYTNGPLYMTGAAEWHQAVNRQSDLAGAYGVPLIFAPQDCSAFFTAPGAVDGNLAQQQCLQDVANEWAAKGGILYTFPTKTTVGGIVEYMHRDVPADLAFQNERTRWGTWLVVSQELNPLDSVYFGWAHAFRSPGNPGQHNDSTLVTANGATFGPNQNQADMVTAEWKHKFSENLIWYSIVAATFNGPDAHYDLGAGGRSVTTDCHDAIAAPGGLTSNAHCWTGTTLVGVSTGLQWRF
ncbi:MAG TPA: porin [Pseudolabrys sp.]|nr:porin [Pseudolabrys sp.]